jgi:hypothetical protein
MPQDHFIQIGPVRARYWQAGTQRLGRRAAARHQSSIGTRPSRTPRRSSLTSSCARKSRWPASRAPSPRSQTQVGLAPTRRPTSTGDAGVKRPACVSVSDRKAPLNLRRKGHRRRAVPSSPEGSPHWNTRFATSSPYVVAGISGPPLCKWWLSSHHSGTRPRRTLRHAEGLTSREGAVSIPSRSTVRNHGRLCGSGRRCRRAMCSTLPDRDLGGGGRDGSCPLHSRPNFACHDPYAVTHHDTEPARRRLSVRFRIGRRAHGFCSGPQNAHAYPSNPVKIALANCSSMSQTFTSTSVGPSTGSAATRWRSGRWAISIRNCTRSRWSPSGPTNR